MKQLKDLWSQDQEITFFTEARQFASLEQLFYLSDEGRYYAYWPKSYKGKKETMQARNALIGRFTERWSANLLHDFAEERGHYVVQGAICNEIGLSQRSSADLAICKTKYIEQRPEDILLILEVKMSVVWNWELKFEGGEGRLICPGDYKTHKGNPGLLRSDTMLKAIGKSINIRVSSLKASKIPIIILGNTPITDNYYEKVDHLRKSGVVQGFWSVNPSPIDSQYAKLPLLGNQERSIKSTEGLGFYRFDAYDELISKLDKLLGEEREYFSGMRTNSELGRIIELANKEGTYEKKAERFLALIRE